MINANPDGNCGLTVIQRYLKTVGHHQLANEFTRSCMINLVKKTYHSSEMSKEEKKRIEGMIQEAGAPDIKTWRKKFVSSGYWLTQSHFAWLSYCYNIHFHFYYTSRELSEEGVFWPEPSYDSIYKGRDPYDKIYVHLAHVNIEEKAILIHFNAIIVEPNKLQNAKIDDYNSERKSTNSTEVSVIHSGVSFYKRSRILTQKKMELNIALERRKRQDAVNNLSESSKFLTAFDFYSSSSEDLFEDEIPDKEDDTGNWSSNSSDKESSFSP